MFKRPAKKEKIKGYQKVDALRNARFEPKENINHNAHNHQNFLNKMIIVRRKLLREANKISLNSAQFKRLNDSFQQAKTSDFRIYPHKND